MNRRVTNNRLRAAISNPDQEKIEEVDFAKINKIFIGLFFSLEQEMEELRVKYCNVKSNKSLSRRTLIDDFMKIISLYDKINLLKQRYVNEASDNLEEEELTIIDNFVENYISDKSLKSEAKDEDL